MSRAEYSFHIREGETPKRLDEITGYLPVNFPTIKIYHPTPGDNSQVNIEIDLHGRNKGRLISVMRNLGYRYHNFVPKPDED